ncbi:MAG: septum formation initiator family protein [Kiritimatiellae bacterium]|nr:septum formation initiator family protein [Kiritimatiellia bacterium]
MSTGAKEKFMHFFTITLLAMIVIGGLVMVYPTYRRGQALKAQNAELQAKIDGKKREISQLTENQRRFRTDADFVESIARQNRRVFPGELVFVFGDE